MSPNDASRHAVERVLDYRERGRSLMKATLILATEVDLSLRYGRRYQGCSGDRERGPEAEGVALVASSRDAGPPAAVADHGSRPIGSVGPTGQHHLSPMDGGRCEDSGRSTGRAKVSLSAAPGRCALMPGDHPPVKAWTACSATGAQCAATPIPPSRSGSPWPPFENALFATRWADGRPSLARRPRSLIGGTAGAAEASGLGSSGAERRWVDRRDGPDRQQRHQGPSVSRGAPKGDSSPSHGRLAWWRDGDTPRAPRCARAGARSPPHCGQPLRHPGREPAHGATIGMKGDTSTGATAPIASTTPCTGREQSRQSSAHAIKGGPSRVTHAATSTGVASTSCSAA